jgi:dephospho-CoA kinase
MRLIGLTGGIATGKSTVAAMFRARGAALVDADALAREVVRPGSPALRDIAAEFGGRALHPGGGLDRAAMAELVFADPTLRRRLEAITHPRIQALMAERIAAELATDAPVVVADVPLLFESARTIRLEGVLLVDCAEETQLRRLMERDGIDSDAARQRIAAQLPMEEKRRRATWILENNGTIDRTAEHFERWWRDTVAAPISDLVRP